MKYIINDLSQNFIVFAMPWLYILSYTNPFMRYPIFSCDHGVFYMVA